MEFFDLKYFCLGGADDSDEASFANKKEEKADGANAATASSSSSSLASVPSSPAKEPQQSHLAMLRGLVRPRSGVDAEDVEDTDGLKHPRLRHRGCTDVGWLAGFVAAVATLATLSYSTRMPEHWDHLASLVAVHNSLNQSCGVGPTSGLPYGYICMSPTGELNFWDLICVSYCPRNGSAVYGCRSEGVELPSYDTKPAIPYVLGWCRPEDPGLYRAVLHYATREWGKFSIGYAMLMIWRLVVPYSIAASCGLCFSWGYVALLKDYAPLLSKMGIRLILLVPWAWAGYLWYEHGQAAVLPCVSLMVCGVCIGCCAASRMHQLDKAASCIKLSCTCVMRTPMLHIGPLLVLLSRTALGLVILACLVFAHTGIFFDLFEHRSLQLQCAGQGQETCTWGFAIFCLWLAMLLWIQLLMTASWEFVVSYLAAEWYVEGGLHGEAQSAKDTCQCCKQLYVWWVLFRYHFGSMVKASIYISAVRPLRGLFGSLAAVAGMKANPVANIVRCCCGCFVDLYEVYFEKYSVNTYTEVALSGQNLRTSADKTEAVSTYQKTAANSLNGTTFIFQLVGLTLVWWVGYFIMWLIVSGSCPGLAHFGDPTSPHYIDHEGFWSNAGGIIALTAAFPAMMVFDVASDTILYCAMLDIMQNESHGTSYWSMPRGVVELLELIDSVSSWWSSSSSDSCGE